MAYSDYGGYAYRNGERIEKRSDFVLTPEGGIGTPGAYPGFAMLAATGGDKDAALALTRNPIYHACLGEGPLYLGLYKQTTFRLHVIAKGQLLYVDPVPFIDEGSKRYLREYEGEQYLDTHDMADDGHMLTLTLDMAKVRIQFEDTDNFYQFAEFEQRGAPIWHGWSGYGVGAGLEDCGYGFNTHNCERRLWDTFNRPSAA